VFFPQAFVILRFGVSLNGRDPPALSHVLLNAALQFVAEFAQSLVCNLFYVVILRHPCMSVPLLRINGFSMVITMLILAVWCECVSSYLPACLGHRAHSKLSWEFVTDRFLIDVNTSALCAAFPEAVGFAEEEC
jgi:hypothetical protein